MLKFGSCSRLRVFCNLETSFLVKQVSFVSKRISALMILLPTFCFIGFWHCMKKRIFLRKFVKSAEKIIFSFVFVYFLFTEISYFLMFPSNENVRKQHLSTSAYFCVNMKFSYMIAGRKDVVLQRKQAIFCWYLGKLFVDNI